MKRYLIAFLYFLFLLGLLVCITGCVATLKADVKAGYDADAGISEVSEIKSK